MRARSRSPFSFAITLALAVAGGGCAGPAREARTGAHAEARPVPLPYYLVDGRSGERLDDAQLKARIAQARVVLVGEEHPNPHHHAAQERVFALAHEVEPHVGLGLEMLPRTLQAPLDDWLAGKSDDPRFLAAVDWKHTWGYPFGFYRPMFELARGAHLPVFALNAERSLTRAVSQKGLDALTPEEKARLPEIVPGPDSHRAFMKEAMGGHAHGDAVTLDDATFERFYGAQLVWDETMAERAAEAVKGGVPKLVLLAGAGHTRPDAIPLRLHRRGVEATLSVLPILEEELAPTLEAHEADVLWVLVPPAGKKKVHGGDAAEK